MPPPIRRAVSATRGEYLAYQDEPILAAFHSSAGGRTASSAEVWGTALPYLSVVDSPDDEEKDQGQPAKEVPADRIAHESLVLRLSSRQCTQGRAAW